MTNEEIVTRLKRIADHAVHIPGEKPFVMSLDDGIAIHEAIEMLSQQTEDAISRQAVIEYIEGSEAELGYRSENELVCQDIKELPPVMPKQEPCGDCISRQAAIDAVNIGNLHPGIVGALQSILADLPPVTAQPKIGHWIDIMVGDMPAQVCDQCKTFYPLSYTGGGHNYCPSCGSRMVEPQESEPGMSEEISREEIAALLARESEEQDDRHS